MSTKTWFENRNNALAWLRETFPKAFNHVCSPLKVGIHNDIFDLNLETAPPRNWIRRGLSYYVNASRYHQHLITGVERIDLQGNACGFVTGDEAMRAKLKRQEVHKNSLARHNNPVAGATKINITEKNGVEATVL